MPYDPKTHHRQSYRLKHYDYSQTGTYLVTLAINERYPLFGKIKNGAMILSEYGKIVLENWSRTPIIRPYVILDEFVIMPDHLHLIVIIKDNLYQHDSSIFDENEVVRFQSPSHNLGAIIRGFKSSVTKEINQIRNTPGKKIWVRNYWCGCLRRGSCYRRSFFVICKAGNTPASRLITLSVCFPEQTR